MLAAAMAVAVFLAVIVALLAVPVVLDIDAERVDTLKARWRVRWLFGLVDIGATGGRPPAAPARREAAGPAPASVRTGKRAARVGIAVVRTHGLLRRVRRVALALLRQVKFERFHLQTAFGFDDPADTGVVYGFLSPLLALARTRGLNVECRPMFLESGLRGAVGATARVRPLSVIGALVAFLLSPPVLRAVGAAWRARR